MIVAGATVRFDEMTYIVREGNRQIQPTLVLSNPVSYTISVKVRSHDKTATGQ